MNVGLYLLRILKEKITKIFSLAGTTDMAGTITTIKSGVPMRGANAWILICGAMLASIGLDLNSSAVIIGAMLISPLMSSILGIGLAVGISDRELLFSSFKNFSIAVGISLVTSFIYFKLTPLGNTTNEMTARITPTLLDVGVAVFGGVAGIVANSRIDKTNAIPGVAIATALMPPLCTAGFGLATGNLQYFFGAFYLFFINAFFISFSTYIIVRYLKFPEVEFLNPESKRKMKRWVMAFATFVTVPSVYILVNVIAEYNFEKDVQAFIGDNIRNEERDVLKWEPVDRDSVLYLKIYVVGEPLTQAQSDTLRDRLEVFDGRFLTSHKIQDMQLKLVQMNVPEDERAAMLNDVALNVMKQIEFEKNVKTTLDSRIDSLMEANRRLTVDSNLIQRVYAESKIWFPEMNELAFGLMASINDSNYRNLQPLVVVDYDLPEKRKEKAELEGRFMKFREYLRRRVGRDSLAIVSSSK